MDSYTLRAIEEQILPNIRCALEPMGLKAHIEDNTLVEGGLSFTIVATDYYGVPEFRHTWRGTEVLCALMSCGHGDTFGEVCASKFLWDFSRRNATCTNGH